ncbi:MAG: hypothetical protein DBW96_03145 [SAR86 cluster bacterium]|uniref:Uncharacterized protein n=1 Tax=SAR86 cluster bacterium TaxID=2030880 RepID=A0A368BUB6_9GAMM|nr:MAG: hypothetical protein DBW96_03145 [SAR86 cluster bacterium]
MTQLKINLSLLLCALLLSPLSYSDANIFASAKELLSIDKPLIKVEYSNSNLVSTCPVGSIGCFSSANGGKIILSENIPTRHHDVVLLGLYSDYLQYADSRVIDELRTCQVKVTYLNQISNTRLANLYEGQCESLFKGKLLVLR